MRAVRRPPNPARASQGSMNASAKRLRKKATSMGWSSSAARRTKTFMIEKKKAAAVMKSAP